MILRMAHRSSAIHVFYILIFFTFHQLAEAQFADIWHSLPISPTVRRGIQATDGSWSSNKHIVPQTPRPQIRPSYGAPVRNTKSAAQYYDTEYTDQGWQALHEMQMYADQLPIPAAQGQNEAEKDNNDFPTNHTQPSLLPVLRPDVQQLRRRQTIIPFNGTIDSCVIPTHLQGNYRRQSRSKSPNQFNNGMREPIIYDHVFIGESISSEWGTCARIEGERIVFAITESSGNICYRCVTLIARTPMVLQALINKETLCYGEVEMALQYGCPLRATNSGAGEWLWSTSTIEYQECALHGASLLQYTNGESLYCRQPVGVGEVGARADNCARPYQIDVQFRRCSFPDYNMSMYCLGTWPSNNALNDTYFALYNVDADEYRCGLMSNSARTGRNSRTMSMSLSNDSSCHSQLIDSTNGFEVFKLTPQETPQTSAISQNLNSRCQFDGWLLGNWSSMTVTEAELVYMEKTNVTKLMGTVLSTCVQSSRRNGYNYYLMDSRTHCGTSLGAHCMRVARRLANLVEVQISPIVLLNSNDATVCQNNQVYANAEWTMMRRPAGYSTNDTPLGKCSSIGIYSTRAPEARICHNITVNCQRPNIMSVVQYSCHNGAIFDSKRYSCLTSWSENEVTFDYVQPFSSETPQCVTSRLVDGSTLLMVVGGEQCKRTVDWGGDGVMKVAVVDDCQRNTAPPPHLSNLLQPPVTPSILLPIPSGTPLFSIKPRRPTTQHVRPTESNVEYMIHNGDRVTTPSGGRRAEGTWVIVSLVFLFLRFDAVHRR